MRIKQSWMQVKKRWYSITVSLALVAVLAVGGVVVDIPSLGQLIDGVWTVTVGTEVQAAGSVDYVTDGTDDQVQIQAAIAAIIAVGGGEVLLLAGTYTLADEITIVGWEAGVVPTEQVMICGSGFSTELHQNGAGKRHFVLSNRASVVLKDMSLTGHWNTGGIEGVNTGANSDISCDMSLFENIKIAGFDESKYAFHLVNEMRTVARKLFVSGNGNGYCFENDSIVTTYGNCQYDHLYATCGTTEKVGMKIVGTNLAAVLRYFGYIELNSFEYGLVLDNMGYSNFEYVVIEDIGATDEIGIDMQNNVRYVNIAGYINGQGATIAINAANATAVKMERLTVDGGAGLTNGVIVGAAATDVRIDVVFMGTITNKVVDSGTRTVAVSNAGYITQNSGTSLGTGAQQTIAHNLDFTPSWDDVGVFSDNVTGTAFQTAVPDAVNIYVTATANSRWHWGTIGR